jgi:hypothetical protein
MKSVKDDIAKGLKAVGAMHKATQKNWNNWSRIVKGLRALRTLIFHETGARSVQADAFKKRMGEMLHTPKYEPFSDASIGKQARSDCYKLADHIEEIDPWLAGRSGDERDEWNHPSTLVKHLQKLAPHLLSGGMKGHNKPPRKPGKKKPMFDAEVERLKAILIRVIRRLAKHEPDAIELLDELTPQPDPSDTLADIGTAPPKASAA